MPDKKIKRLHIAVVMDAWFPNGRHSPGVVGGSQVHVRELINTLERMYPVTFTLFYPAHSYLLYRVLWMIIVWIRLQQHHRKNNFALIHAHELFSGMIANLVGRWLKVPVVHTVHGSHHLDTKSKSLTAKLEKWIFTELKYAAQISVAASFLKYANVNKDVYVIPNGVNIEEFDKVQVEKNEDPTIIWVGKDNPMKGLPHLRQAILKIRKKIPELKTKLVTGGQLTGNALIKAYKRSHVFVLPSLAEGQPITLLEAWAARLPVVVTAVGDNPLMVKDGINGYVVKPNNITQLTAAILKILKARTKNIQMGEAGYTLVKNKYTWKQAAEKTWEVYQKVLE